MKAFSTLLAVYLVPLATANFHISRINLNGDPNDFRDLACPSNYWNCKCFAFNDRGSGIPVSNNPDVFSVSSGLCGMGKMDFYRNTAEGNNVWDYYESGGDGTKIGSCYGNQADKNCFLGFASLQVSDLLVCYGYPCGE